MKLALRCHRCGEYGQAEGTDIYAAEHQAEAAGWVTHAIGHSGGRVTVVDICPSCLAGAAPAPPVAISETSPSGSHAAPRRPFGWEAVNGRPSDQNFAPGCSPRHGGKT